MVHGLLLITAPRGKGQKEGFMTITKIISGDIHISVEHEASWAAHWLKQMDYTYKERPV